MRTGCRPRLRLFAHRREPCLAALVRPRACRTPDFAEQAIEIAEEGAERTPIVATLTGLLNMRGLAVDSIFQVVMFGVLGWFELRRDAQALLSRSVRSYVFLFACSCELFALVRELQLRGKHPSLGLVVVPDIDVGNLLHRMIE